MDGKVLTMLGIASILQVVPCRGMAALKQVCYKHLLLLAVTLAQL